MAERYWSPRPGDEDLIGVVVCKECRQVCVAIWAEVASEELREAAVAMMLGGAASEDPPRFRLEGVQPYRIDPERKDILCHDCSLPIQ